MTREDLQHYALPDAPGVYLFRGPRKEVLYVGKATSLKDRVRSYFGSDLMETRGPRLVKVLEEARSIDWIETDSVLEALILEAQLIRKYQPVGNGREKDNKSYNYVAITKEAYPRVLLIRGRELERKTYDYPVKELFGPFPEGGTLKAALRIIRKIFPFFDTKQPVEQLAGRQHNRLAFNQEIGVYPGVPGELPDKKEYARTIRHISLFFKGKKKSLIAELEREMRQAAKAEEFERAENLKRQLFALTHINDISLIKEEYRKPGGLERTIRIEAYDVAHTSGAETVGVMTVVEDGEKQPSEYRKFKLKEGNDDVGGLREVLLRRFGHDEWLLPRIMVVDGGKAQVNAANAVLKDLGYQIPVVGIVKDEHHRPKELMGDREWTGKYEREIVLANSEAHRFAVSYHRKRRGRLE